MMDSLFVHRVRLKNYKSIGACDVRLSPLTFLVGPNGAGKSNFVDALRLLSEALRTSLDHALRNERGGVQEVRRRSSGHPTHFGIRVDFTLPRTRVPGHYAFKIGAAKDGGFDVQKEECRIGDTTWRVRDGTLTTAPRAVMPPASTDRLFLVNAAGLPGFRDVYDALSSMGFYNLNPERIRSLQAPDKGDVLARDGGNIASVIEKLGKRDPAGLQRIEEFLARVVPGVEGVDAVRLGHMETVEFRQRVEGAKDLWRFPALNMSDGTLRALGVLVALFQRHDVGNDLSVPLVGIEEPETALHPAAAGVLVDALVAASAVRQVLVTSHSPDLLDDDRLGNNNIIAVMARDGRTELAELDVAGRLALQDHLYTPGELLRLDQLQPEPTAVKKAMQLKMFNDEGAADESDIDDGAP